MVAILNSTTIVVHFTDVQKGILPVVAVPCLVISFLLYKFAKRPMLIGETMGKRMEYFYSAVAAALLGHIIFGIMPNMSQPYPICIGAGFFVMMCLQKLSRVWKENDFVSTDLNDNEIHDLVDNNTMKLKTILVEDDLASDNIALNRKRITNQVDEFKKRRAIAAILLFCMFIIAPIDGLYLSEYGKDRTIMVIMFWISKLMQTIVVSVCMIHAFFHGNEVGRIPWYPLWSIAWAFVCAISSLSAILNFEGIVENIPAVMVFYALSTGVLFWVALYFVWIDRKETDRKITIIRLIVFAVVFIVVSITSLFI